MFLFKKKPDKQEKQTSPQKSRVPGWFSSKSSPTKPAPSASDDVDGAWAVIETPGPLLVLQSGAEADVCISDDEAKSLLPRRSRLNKSFGEIINDKHSLPYLIQYLDQHDAGHLIRFWLAAESFAVSSEAKKNVCHREKHNSASATGSTNVLVNDLRSLSDSHLPVKSRTPHNVNLETGKWSHGETVSLTVATNANSDPKNSSHINDGGTGEILTNCPSGVESDAVHIYSKYISKDAQKPIGITEELRNKTISEICPEDGEVHPACFRGCCQFVLDIIQQQYFADIADMCRYFADFLQSEYHCQHQIDVLTSTKVLLPDVLYCDSAMFYFMEYLEQEGAIALLQCWQDLDSFEQLVMTSGGDPTQLQSDAMVLYDKYFSLQASHPLGFPDSVRFEVENNICQETGPRPDSFTAAKLIVLKTLNCVYFMQYLSSDVYYKYLSELINTVQLAVDLPQMRKNHSQADGDASSEHSVSSGGSTSVGSRNTLLAMNTQSQQTRRAINRIDTDMRIDSTFFNPDSLWRRNQEGSLTLGRINEVGQFVSDFDPEPDHEKKKKGTFFQKLKSKDKTQEDMALQIARMIVNEVNQATAQATPGGVDMQHCMVIDDSTLSANAENIQTKTHN
ncbi:hypothetical protein NP493_401g01005 [Ridgeia piscesae]|uniref:RGS domain-containing protein n=1 Tax=Ridgeia piscesae TaxID=27915 RepID=A0AAD9L266_RIDPI|nr:hypothetical protein NP493_401g01005 [Ridgeia piscesae]